MILLPRLPQRIQGVAVGRISKRDAELALHFRVGDAGAARIEAAGHRRHLGGLERLFRRRCNIHQLRRVSDHLLRRRRLVVADVPRAAARVMNRSHDRARDVVDVDAVEHLSRLDDAPRRSSAQRHQRVTAGAIDTRKPQDRGVATGRVGPCLFRRDPHARPVEVRLRRRALVDPAAGVITIYADRGQIDDLAVAARRQQAGEGRDCGIAGTAGRDRNEKDIRVPHAFDRLACRTAAGESMHLDAGESARCAGSRTVPAICEKRPPNRRTKCRAL